MKTNGWQPVILFFGVASLGSVLYYSQVASLGRWGAIVPALYFLPVVVAAINLGAKAASGVAIAAGAILAAASSAGQVDPWRLPLAETLLFACVGLVAARLARQHESVGGVQQAVTNGIRSKSPEHAQATPPAPVLHDVVVSLVRRFRTPVSSIEGAVWLLADTRFPEAERAEFVDIIRKEAHQLEHALSDILDFVQPRQLALSNVDVSVLLDRVIQLAKPGEHGRAPVLRKEVPPDLPTLNCDADLVAKMLHNLVINAVQASPYGGQIRLSAGVEARDLIISVTDPGRSIAPETAQKMFDPFFTTRESGLGLGLTVARQIAVAHGGTITLSHLGEAGTCAKVVLPLNAGEHGSNTGSRG